MRKDAKDEGKAKTSPSPSEGDACEARRGCTKFNATPPNRNNDPLSRSAGEG